MRFIKTNWVKVRLAEVCTKAKCVDIHKKSGIFNYIDIGSIDSISKRISTIQQIEWAKASSRARQVIRKGDILFSTVRVNLERIAFVDKDMSDGIASTGFTVLRSNGQIVPEYLFYSTISPKFIDNLIHSQKGTAYPAVTDKIVLNEEIYLPPIEEQKLIASLFQSIEKYIEQIIIQERSLKLLWINLINDFVSEKPLFGNLIKSNNLRLVRYSEVTRKVMQRIDPMAYGIEKIVAGENLESEDFKIRTWQNIGEGYLGPAFHVLFKPGDILYGSRRTYLKKVAVPDFEGVCANTTYVIRAKEDILLQSLLKHIMVSDRFTQYSIGVSKGSTNPYINWKDLDNFKFHIPDIATQLEIVNVLDGIVGLIEDLKDQKLKMKVLKQNLLNEIIG